MSTEVSLPGSNGSQPPLILPRPARERWQPLRSGLLNLYRYDCEEFWFEQGRMLLRGNNGTGKSRVLALQLPFLLDGEVASHRLEPDGDPAKRIEWNLLMGKHRDRLGYTWLEFGRAESTGQEQYLTIGCGLHAVEGRGAPNRWFFVTSQRIGLDLSLLAPGGHALTREQLIDRVGAHGDVFTTAAAYRAAVNAALFHLSEHQYSALIGLLIQLRKPQLSRQLDEKALSSALGEALRPMPAAVITDVAEAFRGLESDRAILETFTAARSAADQFLVEYRRYAQIIARRLAIAVRNAHSAYERTMRKLRDSQAEREAADSEHETAKASIGQLEKEEVAAAAEVQTLRESPQMKSANELDAARRIAEAREGEAKRDVAGHKNAREQRIGLEKELAKAVERADIGTKEFEGQLRRARQAAEVAGLERGHEDVAASLTDSDNVLQMSRDVVDRVTAAKQHLAALVTRMHAASNHIREHNETVGRMQSEYEQAQKTHSARTRQLDDAEEAHRAAIERHQAETQTLVEAFRRWQAALTELTILDSDEIADALTEWCRNVEGRSPVAIAVSAASEVAARTIASLRADAQQRAKAIDERLTNLVEEREQLVQGRHRPPPTPYTRNPVAREERPGAPLWRLCDFRERVTSRERAGFEAALESSGLLDAWVLPDGSVLSATEHDTFILTEAAAPRSDGQRANEVLQPAVDRAEPRAAVIGDDVVNRVLSRIGIGAGNGEVWIAPDGAWRLGPLSGSWAKNAAEHIGESARDAARRARLSTLAVEIETSEREKIAVESELTSLKERESTTRAEIEAIPDEGSLRDALAFVSSSERQSSALRAQVAELEAQTIECHRVLAEQIHKRDQSASDLGLIRWVDRLSQFDQALTEYRIGAGDLFAAATRLAELDEATDAARHRLEAGVAAERAAFTRLTDSGNAAAEARSIYATMHAAVGAASTEILSRLARAELSSNRIRDDLIQARKAEGDLRARVVAAERDIDAHTETLARDTADRQTAINRQETFAATRLLALCHPSLGDIELGGWSATRAIDIARRIDGVLSAIRSDDAAWDNSQRHIHLHLQTLTNALQPHGYDPAAESAGEVLVVTAAFRGQRCTIAELRGGLDDEIVSRQALLDAREREILENHLVGEVAQHLHELLREGMSWVESMNRELSDRPTSTGMTLRFRWEPAEDGPQEFEEIRRRLVRAGATWSPDERSAVGAFLQRRIQVTRSQNDGGSWLEHLSTALDYRTWHRFAVERQQEGQWKRLTRRTHGTGSSGEKAIALTIPQFAAAAAHYRSADVTAPRLILLDEVFVGIDNDMRSKCMALLAVFDLDFIMTSEREWACYATLPGVSIYQLATRPGIDAVGLTRWVWNGRQRVRSDHPTPALGPPRSGLLDSQPELSWSM